MDGAKAVKQQAERQQKRRSLFNPALRLSKVFGKSASQNPAPATSCDDLSSSIASTTILSPPRSPTTPISKRGKHKPQRVVSPQVVSSMVDSMYAYPVNRESNRLAPPKYQDKNSLHQKSSPRTVASRISAISRGLSEVPLHEPSPIIKPNHSTPGQPSRKDFPSTNYELEPADTRHMGKKPETQDSQDSGSTARIVGRGGSGSRLRLVIPTPEALELNPPLHREQPASLSLQTHHGAGGSRSSQTPANPAPPLLSVLRRRKQQGSSSKGKQRESVQPHPISPQLAYQIANESRSTVSTIRFIGETGLPTPSFFPLEESPELSRPDRISLLLSSSTSTFDSTVEDVSLETWTPSTEDFDLDLYLEDSECPPPEERRKKSLNKLARTLGDFSPEDLHETSPETPEKKNFLPKLFLDDKPMMKDLKKVFRRPSLSGMSSIFVRPLGPRRRSSIKSHHSSSTLTDDLHQLNMGEFSSDSGSGGNSPGSPIVFSPPSPTKIRPATSNPHGVEEEQEFLSVSPPTLSRSHSYSHTPRPRSERLSKHLHSASTSLSLPLDHSTISTSPAWIYPPSDHLEEATFSTASNTAEEPKPQDWTGEWNIELEEVIWTLRALR